MPATEETYRSQPTLHVVFAITSIAMLLSIVWMIMADHLRPWKQVQREFHEIETAKLKATEQEKLAGAAGRSTRPQIDEIDAKIEAGRGDSPSENAGAIRDVDRRARRARRRGSSGSTPRSGSRRPSSTASAASTTA